MTIDELLSQGHTKIRLPRWNEHAYLTIREDGVWADLFDVLAGIGGGDPVPMLVAECAEHTDWVAVAGGSS